MIWNKSLFRGVRKVNTPDTTWRRAILPETSTIQQAIRNLDEVAIKITMVVNTEDELVGTISDGDIRRGLLRGLDLTSPIETVVYRRPLVVTAEVGQELVQQLMAANSIQQIPIVDDQHHVIGLHLWNRMEESDRRENLMVIMAGGMGTRLRPHTEKCPKPMLHVSGRPILEHIIERAKLRGFNRFVLAVNYLGHVIEDYFGDGERLGVRIDYLREDYPLGTAGALSLLDAVPDFPIVVTNGDVLTDIDYGELLDFHIRHRAGATMAVCVHEWQHPFGVIETDGIDIVSVAEKPIARSHVNAGVYALSPSSLAALEKGAYCDMPTLFHLLKGQGSRTVAYPMHEPWLDIGKPDDLDAAQVSKGKNQK